MPDPLWRKKHPERATENARKYYHAKYNEVLRKKRYRDRKCRLCEILLRSCYGGHKKKFYCDGCASTGEALKHARRMASRRFYYLNSVQ